MKILLLGGDQEPIIGGALRNMGEEVIFRSDRITLTEIKALNIGFIVSYNYRHKVSSDIIGAFDKKIINLHISYLPWNRGSHPNFWSFWEDTPRGVTIHYMDEGIDTGEILLQKQVNFDENDTLKTSYERLQREISELFLTHWDDIKNNRIKPMKQISKGTFHYGKDIEVIWSKLEGVGGWNIRLDELAILKTKLDSKY